MTDVDRLFEEAVRAKSERDWSADQVKLAEEMIADWGQRLTKHKEGLELWDAVYTQKLEQAYRAALGKEG